MGKTLYDKVFDAHTVRETGPGLYQLYVSLHLVHEATSAPAFEMLRERGAGVARPGRTFATADHVIPTGNPGRPFADPLAEEMERELERNTQRAGIRYFAPSRNENGIVHVLGPERGLVHPGMVVACGDSHTSTHGAFGAVAFGVGTSQVRDILATQTVIMPRLGVKRILLHGRPAPGVTAKDLALFVISRTGTRAGAGYAFEFAGEAVEAMNMEERMTLCNMAVEAGARVGYVNPDSRTVAYLRGREYSPVDFESAARGWMEWRSDADAQYVQTVEIDVREAGPMVTWGTNPAQAVRVDESIPEASGPDDLDAMEFMGFSAGQSVEGRRVDVVFIGSCTNGRLSDLEAAAEVVRNSGRSVAAHVKALVVPGSHNVYRQAVERGLDDVFRRAGFEFRQPGCSMCLAMNDDRLEAGQVCASTSNRNFKGRQGSPRGRTLLLSPAMAAAAAVAGCITDVRTLSRRFV